MREVEYPSGVRGSGHAEDGVPLVGKSRRASPSLSRGLGDLPYLRLGHQNDVLRDLSHHAGHEREDAPDVRDTDPVCVPWNYGLREVKLPRELAQDLRARRTERGQRPSRSTQLHGKSRLAHLTEPCSSLEHRDQPAGNLLAEGRRERLLEQRAAWRYGVSVSIGQSGAGRRDPVYLG